MAVQKEPRRPVDYGSSEAANGLSVFSEQFDSQFAYNGDDLGCHYEHAQTRFVLWRPLRKKLLSCCTRTIRIQKAAPCRC